MSEEPNQPNLPSVESVNGLFADLNYALDSFMKANPDVPSNFIFVATIRAMLVYPLDWMKNANTSEMYIDMMTDHVKAVYAAYVINDKMNQTD